MQTHLIIAEKGCFSRSRLLQCTPRGSDARYGQCACAETRGVGKAILYLNVLFFLFFLHQKYSRIFSMRVTVSLPAHALALPPRVPRKPFQSAKTSLKVFSSHLALSLLTMVSTGVCKYVLCLLPTHVQALLRGFRPLMDRVLVERIAAETVSPY